MIHVHEVTHGSVLLEKDGMAVFKLAWVLRHPCNTEKEISCTRLHTIVAFPNVQIELTYIDPTPSMYLSPTFPNAQ